MKTNQGRIAPVLIAAGLILGTGAFAQDKMASDSKMSSEKMMTKASDRKFAHDAAIGGMTEVELGRVAVQNAKSDKVKQFGQRMIDDHSKAGDELKSVAAKNNIMLPTELDAKHKAMVEKFRKMNGAAFDKAYMANMVKDHEEDVADFQKEANSGSNTDLKDFAGKTLPTLQDHLRMAKEDNSSLMSSK